MTSILRWKLFSQVSAGPKIPEQVIIFVSFSFRSMGIETLDRANSEICSDLVYGGVEAGD